MLFFTSDQHYSHNRILELVPSRPYESLSHMHEALIANHNQRISPEDTIIMLGDVVMGPKAETIPKIIPRLNGTKILLLGNHDAGFETDGQKFIDKTQIYRDFGFSFVTQGCQNLALLLAQAHCMDLAHSMRDLAIDVCHFPAKGVADHGHEEPRYYKLMPDPSESLLLHGHTHSPNKKTGPKQIHVGVDAWDWCPVSITQLLNLYQEEA